MKKILLVVSVALLIGAMLVVSCCAANFSFNIDDDRLVTVQPDGDYDGGLEGRIAYVFENPIIDYGYSIEIHKMVINLYSDGIYTAEFYFMSNGVESKWDFSSDSDPMVQEGQVDVSAAAGVQYELVIDLFEDVLVGASTSSVTALGPLFNNISRVLAWIPGIFIGLIPIFWTGSALTPLGYLAVAGLSISVILLIVYLISRFLKFRG